MLSTSGDLDELRDPVPPRERGVQPLDECHAKPPRSAYLAGDTGDALALLLHPLAGLLQPAHGEADAHMVLQHVIQVAGIKGQHLRARREPLRDGLDPLEGDHREVRRPLGEQHVRAHPPKGGLAQSVEAPELLVHLDLHIVDLATAQAVGAEARLSDRLALLRFRGMVARVRDTHYLLTGSERECDLGGRWIKTRYA
jgi:hypothetical protein